MTTKWTIRKYPIRDNGKPDDFPWFLFRPGVIPPKTNGGAFWRCISVFATFSEALAWVNYKTAEEYRKTHTVEVVLPEVEEMHLLPSKRQRIDQIMWGVAILDTTNDHDESGESVYIDDSDLKPLGEYLLALHYHYERNKK